MRAFVKWDWLFRNYKAVFIIYGVATIAVTMQSLLLGERMAPSGEFFPEHNNYLIFKHSFFHLVNYRDLYAEFSKEYWDLFKYSPSFPILFAPLAYLPDSIGLLLWNSLNAFCILFAIRALPGGTLQSKIAVLLFILVELITSLQIAQSNALIAGLIILAFAMLEKNRYFLAALCVTLTVFIKVFGVFAFILFIAYPNKGKAILSTIFWSALLLFLPLIVVSFDQLMFLYGRWFNLLIDDHSISYGLSVMGWLRSWFHVNIDKNVIVGIGLAGLGLSYLRWKRFSSDHFRICLLGSVLIWMVIFNHRAESPTYIIAVSGAALWYFFETRSRFDTFLITLVFVFTTLSPTDIFPAFVQDNLFDPFVVKAVPCILVWIKIVVDTVQEKSDLPLPSA